MQTAAENFEHDLAWKLFTLACQYAQALNFHQMDRLDRIVTITLERPFLDHDRRRLWSLIQEDFRYRLLFDKVPALTGNIDQWNVNFPNLKADGDPQVDHTLSIQFIISSRLTFALSDFFHSMEQFDLGNLSDLVSRTKAICSQVNDLYKEWNIVSGHNA